LGTPSVTGKAYQAKKKVLEHRWGTYEASYHNLPNLLHTIVQMNPGSYYDIKDYPCVEKLGKLVLQRSFLALGACIQTFKFVDRSFALMTLFSQANTKEQS
jgi:hypothetical protein